MEVKEAEEEAFKKEVVEVLEEVEEISMIEEILMIEEVAEVALEIEVEDLIEDFKIEEDEVEEEEEEILEDSIIEILVKEIQILAMVDVTLEIVKVSITMGKIFVEILTHKMKKILLKVVRLKRYNFNNKSL